MIPATLEMQQWLAEFLSQFDVVTRYVNDQSDPGPRLSHWDWHEAEGYEVTKGNLTMYFVGVIGQECGRMGRYFLSYDNIFNNAGNTWNDIPSSRKYYWDYPDPPPEIDLLGWIVRKDIGKVR